MGKGLGSLQNGAYVTIKGKTQSLEDYLKGKEDQEKTKDIRKEVLKQSGRFKYATRRISKSSGTGNKLRGVISTRRYTQTDILREEIKMGMKHSTNAKIILMNMMVRQGEWSAPTDFYVGVTSDTPKSTLSPILSKLFKFLYSEGLMVRSKQESEGRTYSYLFDAEVKNPKEELEPLYKKYLEFEKKSYTSKSKTVVETPPIEDDGGKSVEFDFDDNMMNAITQKVLDKLNMKSLNLNVNVTGGVSVRFGFVVEE